MKDSMPARSKISSFRLLLSLAVLLILALPLQGLFADDQITVKHDPDKTAYTIGPDTQNRIEEERERDKAWNMLNNMRVLDKGKRPPTQGQPPQPVQSQ